jgi:hypothetical protein
LTLYLHSTGEDPVKTLTLVPAATCPASKTIATARLFLVGGFTPDQIRQQAAKREHNRPLIEALADAMAQLEVAL